MGINMRRGHDIAPGEHDLCISAVTYSEQSGRVDMTLRDEAGHTLVNCFHIGTPDREQTPQEAKALDVLSYLAEAALGHPCDDLEPEELVGCHVIADVEEEARPVGGSGMMRRFLNVRNFRPAPEDPILYLEPDPYAEDYDWDEGNA